MPVLPYTHTLVAMLGGQPQVVTFTLDLLLRRGITISEVIVIHPYAANKRLQHSLDCLNAEFVNDTYSIDGQTITCHFRRRVLELNNIPIEDISDDTHAKGTRETIYSFFHELKQQPRHIHLSVTGGRRLMSLLAVSAAQLKFDPYDHIWHIYTPDPLKEQVKEGRHMHVPPGSGVELIEVPFMPVNAYFGNIGQVATTAQAVEDYVDAQEHERCQRVIQHFTNKRPYDVLRAFAQGMHPQEVADSLSISLSTVNTHLTKIFDECRAAWGLSLDAHMDYHFLREHFREYFPE